MIYSDVILADSPVAYYRLGESVGTTAFDSSGNSYDGTLTGGVMLGQAGAVVSDTDTSMHFDGATGVITLPAGVNTDGWSAFSVEFWVNRDNNTEFPRAICNNTNAQTNHIGWTVDLDQVGDGHTGYFMVGNGTTGVAAAWGTVPLATGIWYHLVCTYDGSNLRVYQDGVLVSGPVALAGTIGTASGPVYVGAANSSGGNSAAMALDEVAIYHSVLSLGQITAHHDAGIYLDPNSTQQPRTLGGTLLRKFDPRVLSGTLSSYIGGWPAVAPPTGYKGMILADNPVAYYRLGEGGGTTAYDATGNGYNGTITGGVAFDQPGAVVSDTNTSMHFDGTTSYVKLPAGLDTSGWSAFSVEVWIKRDNNTDFARVICNDATADTDHIGWTIDVDNTTDAKTGYFLVGNGTTGVGASWGTAPLAVGVWYHIVCTYDGSNLRAYQNGVLVAGPTALAGTIGTAAGPIYVGAKDSSGVSTPMALDEVALYHLVLTPTQITRHYRAGRGKSLPVRLLLAVQKITSLPTRVQLAVGKSVSLASRVRLAIQRSVSLPARVRLAIGKSASLVSRLRLGVGKRVSLTARVRLGVQRSVSLGVRLRLFIIRSLVVRLLLRQVKSVPARLRLAIGKTVSLATRLRLAVGKVVSLPARVRVSIGKSVSLASRLRVSVGKSVSLPARLRLTIGTAVIRSLVARVRVSIARGVSLPARVRLAISKGVSLATRVRLSVQRSVSLPARVRLSIGKSVSLAQRLRLAIGKGVSLPARVRLSILVRRSLTARVRLSVGRVVSLPVRVRLLQVKSLAVRLRLLTVRSLPLRLRLFTVRSLVARLRLQVSKTVSAPIRLRLQTGTQTVRSLAARLRLAVGLTRSLAARVLLRVGRLVSVPTRLRLAMSRGVSLPARVRVRVALARSLAARVRMSVGKSASLPARVQMRVAANKSAQTRLRLRPVRALGVRLRLQGILASQRSVSVRLMIGTEPLPIVQARVSGARGTITVTGRGKQEF